MAGRADNEALLLRAREPVFLTATGFVFPLGERGLVTAIILTPTLADDAGFELRDGGPTGQIIMEARGKKKEFYPAAFPVGFKFEDGLHCTMTGVTPPAVTFIGTSEQAPV